MRLVAGSGARQASRLGIFGGMVDWAIPLINFRGGLDTLPIELARHVPVTVNAVVDLLVEDSDGVRVEYLADGVRREIRGDVCVLAATFDAAETIYPKLSSYVAGYGEKLKYISMVAVSLAYARAPNSSAYVVQVPTVENQDISLIFLQHNKAPDRVPPGRGLITLYTDAIATSRYAGLSDEAIERWARGDIERLFPEIREHFLFSEITRWQIVGYLATPGFWLRTRDLLRKLPKDSRIQIAGDLFGAGSMESAVTWGQRAAERIIEHWLNSPSSKTSETAANGR
jgi:protoporphyrinogen oxidase